MVNRAKLFAVMFRAEIENSVEDVTALADLYEKRFKSEEISNYVYSENEAFLANEIAGLRSLLTYLETVSVEKYSDAEELASEIDNMIKRKTEVYEDPGAVYGIVSRKIKKILTYLNLRSE